MALFTFYLLHIFLLYVLKFPSTAAIRNGFNAYEMSNDIKTTSSLTMSQREFSWNRLCGAAHIHPRFFLTMQKCISLGVESLTYRTGSLRMFEGGEVGKVELCLVIGTAEIDDDSFRPYLCRLKIPVEWRGFGYMCNWPWKPRGFDRNTWEWEYFKFSGWHGWPGNWVNHQMNTLVVKEVYDRSDCNNFFDMGDKLCGPMYFQCFKDWASSGRNPGRWPKFASLWDEGSAVTVKNTQLLIGLAMGRVKKWTNLGPSLNCQLENLVLEIMRNLVKYDYDEFNQFPEFFIDPNSSPN